MQLASSRGEPSPPELLQLDNPWDNPGVLNI
jgi:hypothetical protein